MPNPLISCVVPVFNGERYLREALDSILAQTYRPLEIIVADDGSTDESQAIAASYGKSVRWRTQVTAGPAAARNFGIAAARGGLVAFLDADDLWHPDKLARQMDCFAARPDLDACVTHIQNFWVDELRDEAERLRDHHLARPQPGYVTMTLLARRPLFDTVGLFNPALWHSDAMDWFLRATERHAKVELLPEVLVYHRLHHTNLSRRMGSGSRTEFVRLVKASLDARRGGDGAMSHPVQVPRQEPPTKP